MTNELESSDFLLFTAILGWMKQNGLFLIKQPYSGSGDSGGLDDVQFIEPSPDTLKVPPEITDALEVLCTSVLDDVQADFNNEGSQGVIYFRQIPPGMWCCHEDNLSYDSEEVRENDLGGRQGEFNYWAKYGDDGMEVDYIANYHDPNNRLVDPDGDPARVKWLRDNGFEPVYTVERDVETVSSEHWYVGEEVENDAPDVSR